MVMISDRSPWTSRPSSAGTQQPSWYQPRTMQQAFNDVFIGGSSLDFSCPGAVSCPWCGCITNEYSCWDILPWTEATAPDRLFLSSSPVASDAELGFPLEPSPTLLSGVKYSLVSVVYHVFGRTHYIKQFRLQGTWL
ncbi:unnamed protein product [Scytosiphon promiscuus]